jgi:uncharacterized membrane protein
LQYISDPAGRASLTRLPRSAAKTEEKPRPLLPGSRWETGHSHRWVRRRADAIVAARFHRNDWDAEDWDRIRSLKRAGSNGVAMKFRQRILAALVSGLLVVVPLYLVALLLLKAINSSMAVVRPIAGLLPDWLPAAQILSLLLVLGICLVVGILVRTRIGSQIWERIQQPIIRKVPGYASIRNLAQQLAGQSHSSAWKPALAEIEEALVPAFIIEELEDGRFTVFVPSIPTPLAGAVYILTADRVHAVDIPFTQAIKAISQWGAGSKYFVAAMEKAGGKQQSRVTARH